MRPGQPAFTIFAHGVEHVAQGMNALAGVLSDQGQVRNDERPLLVADIARIHLAAHGHRLPHPKFMTGSSGSTTQVCLGIDDRR